MDLIYKIEYTASVINDLEHIISYLFDFSNLMIVTNFKNEIKSSLDNIRGFPKSHPTIYNQHG